MRLLARSSVDELFDLKGKHVIVTGAARGNGRAIADGFAAAGCRVFYVDRMFAEDRASYEPIIGHTEIGADITDQESLADVMRIAGDVDVLVNNAGITLSGKQQGQNSWAETLAVNLTGAFRITELVIDGMKRSGGGSIINITSMSAHLGSAGNPAYHASKGGLSQLTKGLAAELGGDNIRVNNVCPGYIRTDMTKDSFANIERRDFISNRTMLGRWGEPDDLQGACLFLASSASSYITGSDIYVDGGLINKGL